MRYTNKDTNTTSREYTVMHSENRVHNMKFYSAQTLIDYIMFLKFNRHGNEVLVYDFNRYEVEENGEKTFKYTLSYHYAKRETA
jgi:hypothetical protein